MASGNNGTVYGGDEINALVLDPGSYHTRIGYAGDDYPKITTTSYYSVPEDSTDITAPPKRIFGESINVPRTGHAIKPIVEKSLITDWDAAIDQYTHYFEALKIDYQEQPILITEPVWSENEYRQKLVETFYEKFDFPALYLAKAPTCVSFQQGRPNCLVVDLGHESVSVTPVIDGISLLKNSMRTHYGGKFLADEVEDFLELKSIKIEPTYKIKTKVPVVFPETANYTLRDVPAVSESYEHYQQEKVLHEFKETALEVPDKRLVNTVKDFYSQEQHQRLFELPTGQAIPLGLERFQLGDSIFDPLTYKFKNPEIGARWGLDNGEMTLTSKYDDYRPLKRGAKKVELNQSTPPPQVVPTAEKLNGLESSYAANSACRGISQLITHTLSTIDIDLRASVAHNIIVTGGISLLPQLTERLYTELSNSNPGLKIRIHAVGNSIERVNQSWIGGSVLASLGTFHQLWVSKEEYAEAGPERILNQRFR